MSSATPPDEPERRLTLRRRTPETPASPAPQGTLHTRIDRHGREVTTVRTRVNDRWVDLPLRDGEGLSAPVATSAHDAMTSAADAARISLADLIPAMRAHTVGFDIGSGDHSVITRVGADGRVTAQRIENSQILRTAENADLAAAPEEVLRSMGIDVRRELQRAEARAFAEAAMGTALAHEAQLPPVDDALARETQQRLADMLRRNRPPVLLAVAETPRVDDTYLDTPGTYRVDAALRFMAENLVYGRTNLHRGPEEVIYVRLFLTAQREPLLITLYRFTLEEVQVAAYGAAIIPIANHDQAIHLVNYTNLGDLLDGMKEVLAMHSDLDAFLAPPDGINRWVR